MDVNVDIKNISKNPNPVYVNASDAGCDVRADFSRITPNDPIKAKGNSQFVFSTPNNPAYLILDPGCRALIPTGLFIDIPEGYEVQVRSRSGLALKSGIQVLNSPGTVDAKL